MLFPVHSVILLCFGGLLAHGLTPMQTKCMQHHSLRIEQVQFCLHACWMLFASLLIVFMMLLVLEASAGSTAHFLFWIWCWSSFLWMWTVHHGKRACVLVENINEQPRLIYDILCESASVDEWWKTKRDRRKVSTRECFLVQSFCRHLLHTVAFWTRFCSPSGPPMVNNLVLLQMHVWIRLHLGGQDLIQEAFKISIHVSKFITDHWPGATIGTTEC